jgi:hypothetical protein
MTNKQTPIEPVDYDITGRSAEDLSKANYGEGHLEIRGEKVFFVCDTFRRKLSPKAQRKGFLA